MVRKKGSIIAAVLASLSICTVFAFTPIQASAAVNRQTGEQVSINTDTYEQSVAKGEYDPNYKSIYSGGWTYARNPDGTVSEDSIKGQLKMQITCHNYQKINEQNLRNECTKYGLDFDSLVEHERPQVLRIGWVQNAHGYWFYSRDGKTWATGWLHLGDEDYYCGDTMDEYARVGWVKIDNTWYCFNGDSSLMKNKTVDGYYVNANGQALSKND